MQLYVRNMQVICNYMSEICKKYAQYIDCISQIWKKYALNMPEICTNMQIICSYMLKICSYMPKICNKYAQYIDCISRICKKYAVKICRNMQFYMQNMHKSIYCIYCIYMHSPLCWWTPSQWLPVRLWQWLLSQSRQAWQNCSVAVDHELEFLRGKSKWTDTLAKLAVGTVRMGRQAGCRIRCISTIYLQPTISRMQRIRVSGKLSHIWILDSIEKSYFEANQGASQIYLKKSDKDRLSH